MNMIITSECEECAHGHVDDSDKAAVKVHCKAKKKTYYWGQCIPCDNKEKKNKGGVLYKNNYE